MSKPTLTDRHRWRAAVRIEQQLQTRRARSPEFGSEVHWDRFRQTSRRLELALRRDWPAAARSQRRAVLRASALLRQQLEQSELALEAGLTRPPELSVREIVADLAALPAEFARMTLDLRARQLTVVTDPIVLEDLDLGPFAIRLTWERIGASYPYDVIALEPHPASHDTSVVHPHVRDQTLCEGDGQAAVRAALLEGRLFEFFLLVRQILETYNPDSAYVPLERWWGECCCDCGETVGRDDGSECHRCQAQLCGDCAYGCTECHETCCSECHDRCTDCGTRVCSRCELTCDDCGASCCGDCLTDGRCAGCAPVPDPVPEETSDVDPPLAAATAPSTAALSFPASPSPAAVDAHRLGEAAVPA